MTTPTSSPAPAPAEGDQVLADRCQSSGDYLAGLIAHGMLQAASRPGKLPELLFPDGDPDTVREVWEAALAVGYRAGQLSVRPSWTPAALNRLRGALADAGYQAMGRLVARSASLHPPRHPADDEAQQVDPAAGLVRDGGHP